MKKGYKNQIILHVIIQKRNLETKPFMIHFAKWLFNEFVNNLIKINPLHSYQLYTAYYKFLLNKNNKLMYVYRYYLNLVNLMHY